MSKSNNLDALVADLEVSFGHPGRNFDSSDERYEPPLVDPREEGVFHYGPGYWPLCGEEEEPAVHTDDPHQVSGRADCLELVAEDLADGNVYRGHYCTVGRRSGPKAGLHGVGRSGGPALTAAGPGGEKAERVRGVQQFAYSPRWVPHCNNHTMRTERLSVCKHSQKGITKSLYGP